MTTHTFGRRPATAAEQVAGPSYQPAPLEPLPAGQGGRLDLADVLGADAVAAIEARGGLSMHCVGDTGGVVSGEPQQRVADAMAAGPAPDLLYHLGDVVYYNGEDSAYYGQFYEPYGHLPWPIVAIPGNHDGWALPGDTSLAGFQRNFCASAAGTRSPDAGDEERTAMTQPYVYWTLTAPFVTVVGVYTNTTPGGHVDDTQRQWLAAELKAADPAKSLVVALHHPPFSADALHGSCPEMTKMIADAAGQAARGPDLVLSGHVHDYQRFSYDGVPYVVAGAGGYWRLHRMARLPDGSPLPRPWDTGQPGLTLQAYCDDAHGYLNLTFSPAGIAGVYVPVPDSPSAPGTPDSFTVPRP